VRYVHTALTSLVLLGSLLMFAGPAVSVPTGSCSVATAKRDVAHAKRDLVRAERRLVEARHVLSATRAAGLKYGNGVGRWVRLARQVGWPWATIPDLTKCISGESGGDPTNSNGVCRSLLQIHECHASAFKAVTGLPYFNGVYVPRANLKFGLHLWRAEGWGPWQVMQ